jgi:hypothetical protein
MIELHHVYLNETIEIVICAFGLLTSRGASLCAAALVLIGNHLGGWLA